MAPPRCSGTAPAMATTTRSFTRLKKTGIVEEEEELLRVKYLCLDDDVCSCNGICAGAAPPRCAATASAAWTMTKNVTSLKKDGIVEEEEEMEWGELRMLSSIELIDRLL